MVCESCGKDNLDQNKFCINCGLEIEKRKTKKQEIVNKSSMSLNKIGIIILALLLTTTLIILWSVLNNEKVYQEKITIEFLKLQDQENNKEVKKLSLQKKIISSVVNIYCTDTQTNEEFGGSGTIISSEGLIVTNSHIIPQDEEFINISDEGCLVSLPDPEDGGPNEIYWAQPTVYPGLSDDYDIAYLNIDSVYIDEDGESYGEFPKEFLSYDDEGLCGTGEFFELGDKIFIYGYPSIGGGASLTITEGIISSFPGDGYIMTSAKIGQGNSGGLAVDEDGCWVGIPSAVIQGEYESLGVIISKDLINDFLGELNALLDLEENLSQYDEQLEESVISYPGYVIKYDIENYDENVELVQGWLDIFYGYDLEIDGFFGQDTIDAIYDFQRNNGLAVDGIIGPSTWNKIFQ